MARIDWMLDHMRTNLECNMRRACLWEFRLRTRTVEDMRRLAQKLRTLRYQTTEETMVAESKYIPARRVKGKPGGKSKGRWKDFIGPPAVSAFYRGVSNATVLKRRLKTVLTLAKACNARYEKLDTWDPEEFEMIFGPPRAMSLADATWRLKKLTDSGLKRGADLLYTFCINARSVPACMRTLRKAGYTKIARAPKDADWKISVDVAGTNDERRFKQALEAMKTAALAAGGKLRGAVM